MKRIRYAVALVTMIASTLLVGAGVGAGGANAADLAASGWWWRAQGGTGLAPGAAPPLPGSPAPVPVVPSPPTVPEGGLMVAGTPEGATAIAALRFELGEDETMPVLSLAIERESGGAAAILAACLTGSAWQPAAAGNWGDKPFAACSEGSVNGVLSDDATSFTFALGPLLTNGLIDVVLVPGTVEGAPEGANGSPFEVVFKAPTAASLQTTSGTPPDSASFDVPGIGGDSGFGDPGAGTGGDSFSAPETTPSADFSAPTSPSASFQTPTTPEVAAPAFTPAVEPESQGLTATAPAVERATRPIAATPADTTDPRVLAGIVLALGAAAILWSSQQATPGHTRLLGRFGGGAAVAGATAGAVPAMVPLKGGVGRFARVRSGAPPRL